MKWRIITKPFKNKNALLVNFNAFLVLFFLIISTLISPLSAKQQSEHVELNITFKKLKNIKAPIKIELFRLLIKETTDWQQILPLSTKIVTLHNNESIIVFDKIVPGKYSIRAFQDTNNNNILDKSLSSIPREPVAFSQNPNLFKGEPSPEETAFIIQEDTSISINFKQPRKKKKRKKRKY